MEHLLFTGATAPIVVPYFCTEDWDGGDFLTYPQRKGWDITAWESSTNRYELDTGGHSFKEMSAFLQVWLFFGLLESVLGVKIPKEDFTRLKDDGKDGKQTVMTTTRLKQYLEDWRRRVSNLSEEEKVRYEEVIWDLMSEAVEVNGHLNCQLFYGEHIPESEPLLESLFCQTLLELALWRALDDILPRIKWSRLENPNQLKLLQDRMIAAGWCPYTVSFLEHRLTPDAQAFMFSLHTLSAQQDHSPCKSAGFDEIGCHCVADPIDGAATLKARHVTPDCECQPLGPPAHKIIELIEEGWTPVVAIATSDDTDEIEILATGIKFDAETKMDTYFALSHVWKDGLGNHEQNTLPTCQIRRLAGLLHSLGDIETDLVANLETDSNLGNRRVTVDFWLDTLCIPVQPQFQKLRDRCIQKMQKIYLTAFGVVVLEPELQQVASTAKPIEVVARLLCSPWKTRLWTYQEGSLAWGLYLAGQNCIFVLRELQSAIHEFSDSENGDAPEHIDRDIVEFQVARALMVACGRAILSLRSDLEGNAEDALDKMLRAISHRSTGREGDETICIATFIGIDPTPLLDTVPQQRMTTLLQILPCIPSSIFFATGPRQQTPGFRWAPLTFLAPHGIGSEVRFPSSYTPDPAEPKARVPIPTSFLHPQGLGLAVFFSGIRFAVRPDIPIPEAFSVVTTDGTGYVITFHDSGLDQTWAEVSPDKFEGMAGIIFAYPNLDTCGTSLLVEMLGQATEEGHEQCRWRCLVEVKHLDEVELASKKAEIVQKHRFTGEYVPFQWWVID